MPQIGPRLQYNGGKCRQKTTISRGASCKFVSRRKCITWRLLAILRFAHDRPMLQIGPNLLSCGGKSLPRTHAATNRDFDDDRRAALWLHHGAGGRPFCPGICGLWRRCDDMRPPSGSHIGGWRAAWIMTTNDDPWPPSGSHIGAGGRPFVPVSADYHKYAALWLPYRGWRATFCPIICGL